MNTDGRTHEFRLHREAGEVQSGAREHSGLYSEDGHWACFQGDGFGGSRNWRVASFKLVAARSQRRLTKLFASDLCGLGIFVRGLGDWLPNDCVSLASGERRAVTATTKDAEHTEKK